MTPEGANVCNKKIEIPTTPEGLNVALMQPVNFCYGYCPPGQRHQHILEPPCKRGETRYCRKLTSREALEFLPDFA